MSLHLKIRDLEPRLEKRSLVQYKLGFPFCRFDGIFARLFYQEPHFMFFASNSRQFVWALFSGFLVEAAKPFQWL